ncbi:hypothetical protein PsYK624_052680 [Phanerochaete sordida]|uniref:Uncharacterized protein n=1 Tax=Phanerochaete sordida TaxID=48140 RepID=A0A9P3LCG9_9APHY|nr:hypothetical protein PsYK624_052680 [Phanerochaete sordida]
MSADSTHIRASMDNFSIYSDILQINELKGELSSANIDEDYRLAPLASENGYVCGGDPSVPNGAYRVYLNRADDDSGEEMVDELNADEDDDEFYADTDAFFDTAQKRSPSARSPAPPRRARLRL